MQRLHALRRTRAGRAAQVYVVAAAPLVAGATALAFDDTHLDEITVPLEVYAESRIAVISALPAPTRDEKSERKKLESFVKATAKDAKALKDDFRELVSAGGTFDGLGAAAAAAQSALDACFTRAQLSLSERTELLADHLELITEAKPLAKIVAKRDAAAAARTAAAAETKQSKRAKLLQKCESLVTGALKKAEKQVLAETKPLPPTRLRSGDVVGPAGGRVAIPRDAGIPLAGASLVIPAGALSTVQTVTLAPGPDFVIGGALVAGPALHVTPDGLDLNQPVRAFLPYSVPPGSDAADLTVSFHTASSDATLVVAQVRPDGLVSATHTTLGSFQPSVAPPVLGQPSGEYLLMTMYVTGSPGTGSGPALAVSVAQQDVTFGRTGVGRTTFGTSRVVSRQWTGVSPHHADSASLGPAGGVDFTWIASSTQGRFSIDLPAGGSTVLAQGAASDDGRIITFAGRGGGTSVFAVGLRRGTNVAFGDLSGAWTLAETGFAMRDAGLTPFRTTIQTLRRKVSVAGDGTVNFQTSGSVDTADVNYASTSMPPVHTLTAALAADGGVETWTSTSEGRFGDASLRRIGVADPVRGVMVYLWYDAAAYTLRMGVGTRTADPFTATTGGAARAFARFDLAQTAGVPSNVSSTFEGLGRAGTLSVTGASVSSTIESGSRDVHTLTGTSSGAAIAWNLVSTTAFAAPSPQGYTLVQATDGSFTAPDGLFAFSSDGSVIVGTPPAGSHGIVLGAR